jgi:uncharacterized membrane protein YjfL (UPF0719 family)
MIIETLSALGAASFAGLFIPMDQLGDYVVSSLIFSAIGIILFALAYYVIVKASPFSIRKEIEEDQNVALAIVIASVIIGLAMIVSAAIHG